MTMPLRMKLAGLAVLAAMSTLLTGAAGFRSVRTLTLALEAEDTAQAGVRALSMADMMHDALRADVLDATRAENDAQAVELRTRVAEHARAIQDRIDEAAALPLTRRSHELIAGVRATVERYASSATAIVTEAASDRATAARSIEPFMAIFRELEEGLEEIADAANADAKAATAAAHATAATTARTVAGLTLLMLTLVAACSGYLIRNLTGSIDSVARFTSALADGHVGRRLPVSGNDEIARMSTALNTATAGMQTAFATERVDWQQLGDTVRKAFLTRQMVESAPLNIVYADADGLIRYINPAARRTFEGVRGHLQLASGDPVGQPLAAIHRDAVVERSTLPRGMEVQLGADTFTLQLSAITDESGQFVGTMATLQLVTEERAGQARERAAKAQVESVLATVRNDAQTLASAAEEMSAITGQLSINATEASSRSSEVAEHASQVRGSVETAATGLDQMGASIREIAANASQAAAVAAEAVSAADATREKMDRLDNSSAQIGNVIKVITAIAQQTSLLALNATIEAARAGEMGKGFAVVANEVKELAKATAKATDEVSRMIVAIQNDARDAVSAIGGISATITRVNDISASIASAVEEQSATTTEMARNVAQAAESAAQITGRIDRLSEMAQNTSSGVDEGRTAATELARLAAHLRALATGGEDLVA